MKKIHLIAAVCAAAGALFVTGCSVFAPAKAEAKAEAKVEAKVEAQHYVTVEQKAAADALNGATAPEWLVPGVHVSKGISGILHVCQPANVSYDEDGMLRVRVVADTDELPFFTWLFFPNRTYKFTYRFVWFDESGKVFKGMTPVDCREVMPGDPVRFSGKASDTAIKKFALILTPGCSGACKEAENK